MVYLGQGRDLAELGKPLRDHRVRLEDIVDVLLDHPVELVKPPVVLAASNGDIDLGAEWGHRRWECRGCLRLGTSPEGA